MSILLFEHNLNALNAVKTAWKTTNRTCIIHATGTGKSLVISKNIEENPNAKHLFLSPSTFIFEEIKKHLAKAISQKVLFQSYAYLLDKEDFEEEFLNLDFIYLDEFHRVGATKWGNAVLNVLTANPKAKVLGTSATPIRYLDDSRNMAEELFDNNIASELPLGEAILRGIHKKPKYVTTLYNYSDILSKTRNKIQKSNLDDIKKNQELERLRSVEINWNSSKGIDTILKKHLNVDRKKILVFCRDTEHREEALKLLKPILNKIYKSKIDYYSVGSDLPEKTNFETISTFRKDVEQASVLFSVNMLNEGLHVDGTDTCIFFRDTESPIIYFQQLGRVFHTKQLEQPLIIDLINNFKLSYGGNVFAKKAFESFGEKGFTKAIDLSLVIDFYDEIKDFSDVIDSFKIESWEIRYQEVMNFFNQKQKLPNKKNSILGNWIVRQRFLFKEDKLSQERIDLLLEITPNFFDRIEDLWLKRFKELQIYFSKHNTIPVARDGILGGFVHRVKNLYNSENLSQEKINLLLDITPDFFERKKDFPSWLKRHKELKNHFNLNNEIPSQNKGSLGIWAYTQKQSYKLKILSQEKIDLLLDITPDFFQINQADSNWHKKRNELKVYFERNKKLPISKSDLGIWISTQKVNFNKNALSKERIDLLLEISPDFFENSFDKAWNDKYLELKEYVEKNNKQPSSKGKLGYWLSNQKTNFNKNTLSKERIDLLLEISPDFFENINL
ncbi:hypothetical protein B0A67_24275 [Flavobacterium aquidurense]|uniref:Helicase associated domain protein n=1 Tax=Flavobacterium aquidurense TaxID=362413 RepID=UPI0009177036|nr:Helicase associated domain protein [Flavobacterium aquidurense]OXA65574.1 hypothetical protein B0A67_24275 [Flavobacterium aquidurense]SHH90050.1 Superfamily II DNA or RNA helicase [Flavobacterium frigidimaris]